MRSETPRITTAQVKVGDLLLRRGDHIGRPDVQYRVLAIDKGKPRRFHLEGYSSYNHPPATQLSAENICIVERDGKIIGHFFTAYW